MLKQTRRPSVHTVLSAAVVATLASSGMAQTNGTWIVQGTGSYPTTTNWTGGIVATGAGAAFDTNVNLTAAGVINLDGNQTLGSATFLDSDVTGAFSWSVNTGAVTTNTLTLQGAGSTAGTINSGYVSGNATPGLTNGQGINFAAPVLAPTGLNINIGQFGTGIMGRRNTVNFTNTASSFAGTVNINGIGDVLVRTGAAAWSGVTQVNVTNPFTTAGGTQGAGNRVTRLQLANGTYAFPVTLTGGVSGDTRVGITGEGAASTILNGNITLLGGTSATFEHTAAAGNLVFNGSVNGTGATAGGILVRGVGTTTFNGAINLPSSNAAAPLTRTDAGTAVFNSTIDAYALNLGAQGITRVPSLSQLSANTRLQMAGGVLDTGGTVTMALGNGPGQMDATTTNGLNISAVGPTTLNFGGAAATLKFDSATSFTAPNVTTTLGAVTLDFNSSAFDPEVPGALPLGYVVSGTGITAGTTILAVPDPTFGPGSKSAQMSAVATANGTVTLTFSSPTLPNRINGALGLQNNTTGTGDLTVLNPLDLNATNLVAPTLRTINVGSRTATLSGAVTNSGAGIGTFVKGGVGKLIIGAPLTTNGNFRITGGSVEVASGVSATVANLDIAGGSMNAAAINAFTFTGNVYLSNGTIDLPSTTTGSLAYTIGGPLSGVTSSNIIFTAADGTAGGAAGFNNTSATPLSITFNGGATLTPGTTASFNVAGWRLGPNATASTTITNDVAIAAGNYNLINENTTGVELIVTGNQTGGTPGSLTKNGPGVAVFKGSSNHSGQSRIFAGTLAITNPGALGTFTTNNFDVPFDVATSTLRFDAPMTMTAPGAAGTASNMRFGAVGANNFNMDTNGNAVTLDKVSMSSGDNGSRFSKQGAGTLTLNLQPDAGTVSEIRAFSVVNGTLKIAASGALTTATLGANGSSNTTSIAVGTNLNLPAGVTTSNGTLEITPTGGVATTQYMVIGRENSTGTVNVNGGTVNIGLEILMGSGSTAGSVSNFNLNSGTATAVFLRAGDGFTNATVNLNGGTLTTTRVSKSTATSVSTFNANGGTLSPRVDAGRASTLPTYFEGLDNAYMLAGGLKVDTAGISTQTSTVAPLVPYTMAINQSFQHDPALGATLDGGFTKLGLGDLFLGGNNTFTGPTKVQVGRLIANSATAFGKGTLTVSSGAIADTKPGLTSPVIIGGIDTTAGGVVKLNDNTLVVDYSGAVAPLASVRDSIKQYYGTGAWDGTAGLTVGTAPAAGFAIAYVDTAVLASIPTPFDTVADATSIIVRVARAGDSDLSGTVGFEDLLALAQNYDALGSGRTWQQGDFNYDGVAEFADLLTLAQNYNLSGLGSDFASDWALAQSLVPEPTSLSLLGLLAFGRRRRDR